MACSPWVRNVKKETVHLGFLAPTLSLRSVTHNLHPLLSFMDQSWLLRWAVSPEIWMRSLSIRYIVDFLLYSQLLPFLFLLQFGLHVCVDAFYRFSSVIQFCKPEALDYRVCLFWPMQILTLGSVIRITAALSIPTLLTSCLSLTGSLMVWLKSICQSCY